MRRVLMLSPHFPPDTSAGAHRVRLLAPHLAAHGWEPTVLTVDPRDYEGRIDPGLAELVPGHLEIVRCRAWSPRWTRRLGFGDLGLRAFAGLRSASFGLLARRRFDAVFVTIYPTYPALLGAELKRRAGIPFVLDYQDPWVGAWGLTVGGAPDGSPDLRSRVNRRIARFLEPRALRHADAITAVSSRAGDELRSRYAWLRDVPYATIPIGGEPADFETLRSRGRSNPYFDSKDGRAHVCYVGTLLPLGLETLRAVLAAAAMLRTRSTALFDRLRLHFFGTSNQTTASARYRVLPIARELGVDDCVTEIPARVDYLDALTIQTDATAILMMGSSEPHYTASKLYPGLLSERPILAVYHEASSVVDILRRAAEPPTARVVTYGDERRAASRVAEICRELTALVENPVFDPTVVRMETVRQYSAAALAETLAGVLNMVATRR